MEENIKVYPPPQKKNHFFFKKIKITPKKYFYLHIVKTQLNPNLNQIKVGLTTLWVCNPRNNRLRDT